MINGLIIALFLVLLSLYISFHISLPPFNRSHWNVIDHVLFVIQFLFLSPMLLIVFCALWGALYKALELIVNL